MISDNADPAGKGISLSCSRVGEPKINIRPEVKSQIEQFARGDLRNERGGILIGNFEERDGSYSISITGFIEAKHTDYSSATLKFTHETWNDIHAVKDERFPNEKIIGWFHTHPGIGVFLSHYDLFIHRNFFQEIWQVAYVMDPVAGNEGLFYWHNGKILPQEMVKKTAVAGAGTKKRGKDKVPALRDLKDCVDKTTLNLLVSVFIAGLILGSVLGGFFVAWLPGMFQNVKSVLQPSGALADLDPQSLRILFFLLGFSLLLVVALLIALSVGMSRKSFTARKKVG